MQMALKQQSYYGKSSLFFDRNQRRKTTAFTLKIGTFFLKSITIWSHVSYNWMYDDVRDPLVKVLVMMLQDLTFFWVWTKYILTYGTVQALYFDSLLFS